MWWRACKLALRCVCVCVLALPVAALWAWRPSTVVVVVVAVVLLVRCSVRGSKFRPTRSWVARPPGRSCYCCCRGVARVAGVFVLLVARVADAVVVVVGVCSGGR